MIKIQLQAEDIVKLKLQLEESCIKNERELDMIQKKYENVECETKMLVNKRREHGKKEVQLRAELAETQKKLSETAESLQKVNKKKKQYKSKLKTLEAQIRESHSKPILQPSATNTKYAGKLQTHVMLAHKHRSLKDW
eukprot:TRINITY_DN17321_c0_g1_i3.p1 TRINITY_DN17321_c0_g1~~TRINITY_DN17321_c0_g1_i3.p1  ORF type:complete len:138 (-),score=21.55 TRINITY_DN17321_c0_g1_i3:121-534(-)